MARDLLEVRFQSGGQSMARSQRLRLKEVRAVYRLIQECRERGGDWEAWSRHLLTETARLVDAQVAVSGGGRTIDGNRLLPLGPMQTIGWTDAAAEALFHEYVRISAALHNPCLCRFVSLGLPTATLTRRQLLDDRTWYGSDQYHDWFKPMGIDDALTAMHTNPGTEVSLLISLHRPLGVRLFERRERQLVRLVQQEVAPLAGTALAVAGEPGLLTLSPRLRQTLLCLLEGDGEKQAARRLGLSTATVHQYVGQLYRHFGVNDRAELLALFLRRSGLLTGLRALLAEPSPPETAE